MKKTSKIIITLIVLIMIGTIILPVFSMLPVNMGTICGFLGKIANSMVVKASDDYAYSGNIVFNLNARDELYVYCTDYLWNKTVKCSINNSEFEDFTIGSDIIPTNKDVTSFILKENDNQEIAKCIIIKDDDKFIIMQNSKTQYQLGDMIYARLKDGQEDYDYFGTDYEYSLDEGNTYRDLNTFRRGPHIYVYWDKSQKVYGGTLFSDKILIRRKSDNTIVYETKNLEEFEEEYEYGNGKTTVKFKNSGEDIENIKYSYEIEGKKFEGNEFEVEENTNVMLNAEANIEFSNKSTEKEIEVKVIKVESPEIQIDEENNLELVAGGVKNDELGKMYYKIDDGEETEYTEKVKLNLEPGSHAIKAYQVSENENVKSKEVEKEITIEEKEEVVYKILEGDNQTYVIGTDEELTIKASGNISKFKELKVDGKKLDSANYQVVSGSTVVTLKQAYLNTLQAGTHKLTFVYTDGEVSAEFVIAKTEVEKKESEIVKIKNNKNNSSTPKTGDKIIISIIVLLVVIILNIVIKNKKNK